jgi:hypothetical protein
VAGILEMDDGITLLQDGLGTHVASRILLQLGTVPIVIAQIWQATLSTNFA